MVPVPWIAYRNDRLFVLDISVTRVERYTDVDVGEITEVIVGGDLTTGGKYKWTLTTRRNHIGYPPTRVDHFESLGELLAYVRKAEPETPRQSLGGSSPDPVPSYEEYLEWLADNGLQGALEQKLRFGGYFVHPDWQERLVWETRQLAEHLGDAFSVTPSRSAMKCVWEPASVSASAVVHSRRASAKAF
jgi:hypothetical protein